MAKADKDFLFLWILSFCTLFIYYYSVYGWCDSVLDGLEQDQIKVLYGFWGSGIIRH